MKAGEVVSWKKVCRIGTVEVGWHAGRRGSVYVEIEVTNYGNLSISGVVGPIPNGNALGGCGQIDGDFEHRNPEDNDSRTNHPIKPSEINFAPGWNKKLWLDFLDIWDRWHLNDLKASCEHQRALGWDKERIDPTKPAEAYGKFYPGQYMDSWNLKGWVHPPHGHLTEPCPVCGYKYGTSWLREDVPQDVMDFLKALPDTDKQPAWV